ncbi:flavoprotein oxygenase [Grosmannia clavigera kw1407]|uniref:Flavoprotein oxygenase n=1 Tax=Grosmannia clavigera (strain kw1407 / UAMH 11150) TaxID=655863 RepID=F0XH54_GROCL|nr:flavoprotein oxygenase [Grosmannia clavigera kw1407]EFX03204.1 flavoprotein oxygenase [Grosmannia clavigera kw1407]
MSASDAAAAAAALASRNATEAAIKRNPHGDFGAVEAGRPDWDAAAAPHFSKAPAPGWQWGQGGNDGGASLAKAHGQRRSARTRTTGPADGSAANLAPFSYTNVVNHDPPIFTIGIVGGLANAKDSLANLAATGECVLNIVSEHFIEAANATSVNAPYGVSEWALTGLHKAPTTHVKPARIQEAIVAIECKVVELKEFESRANPGKKSGTLIILEGVNFWVREDAINEEQNLIDPDVLRPVGRLGGITYSRNNEVYEMLRPTFDSVKKGGERTRAAEGGVCQELDTACFFPYKFT